MLLSSWQKYYGNTPILGWELRDSKADIWFRIHFLPESKRYPESAEEENIVLERYYSVAKDLLSYPSLSYAYWYAYKEFNCLSGSVISHFDDDFMKTDIYSSNIQFDNTQEMSELLLAIANDELSQVMFLNPKNGDVFAPYDGGADLFVNDQNVRTVLKKKYTKWASQRKDGL